MRFVAFASLMAAIAMTQSSAAAPAANWHSGMARIAGSQGSAATPAAADSDQLMQRGDALLATGDIAAARLFYGRAAESGLAKAATAMGRTFDPLHFAKWKIQGIRPEPLVAAEWYRKAAALGDGQAA
ncbi:MAG: hypothetical protein JO010_13225, partial [Alphaproteobacteria bacterium]|nr:hypothetical protein [Alphaproteobacteria bacterium]